MTTKEKLLKKLNQIEVMETWPYRLKKLKEREVNPLSEADFCKKYGFDDTYFNKMKNGSRFPKEPLYQKVEAAFEAEKV